MYVRPNRPPQAEAGSKAHPERSRRFGARALVSPGAELCITYTAFDAQLRGDAVASTELRTFREDDRAELRALFARAGEGSPSGTLWGHLPSETAIHLDPYMDHVPDSLLVALVDGRMAGYLTGCPDPSAMPGESELMDRAIREHRLTLRRGPAAFFARAGFEPRGPAPVVPGVRFRGERVHQRTMVWSP